MEDPSIAALDFVGVPAMVKISNALWITWFEVACEQEGRARSARAQAVAAKRHGLEFGIAFAREFRAGLVSIAASAHALDALYGRLVTDAIKEVGPKEAARRDAHIRECLKRRFETGQRDGPWVAEFRWLFDLRDAAVHAKEELLPAVPHPSGLTQSGQMNQNYSAEATMRGVDLFRDVMETCLSKPKARDAEAAMWALQNLEAFRQIDTALLVDRDARPLATYEELSQIDA